MSERISTRRRTSKGAATARQATASVHFRMPAGLRSRLRRFAEERNLGESEALRLAVSERLDQIDDERELEAAERWQFEQAYASLQEYLQSGRRGGVPPDVIHRMFDEALANIPPKRVPK